MKRIYDTIVIFDTAIDETTIDQKIQKIEGVIKTNEGEILKTEKWGKKKLAYEIQKKSEGYYVYINHTGEGGVVDQLRNLFRFDETILKYITVHIEEVRKSRYTKNKSKKKEKPVETAATASTEAEGGESNG